MKKIIFLLPILIISFNVNAGSFLFTDVNNNRVVHPINFEENNPNIRIKVCIDEKSQNRNELIIPVKNMISTWNEREATVQNKGQIDQNKYDAETVLLHEMGHCLGMDHSNMGSLVPSADRSYTISSPGNNNMYDLDAGADKIIGSPVDQRLDDVNRHLFIKNVNNPFILPTPIDSTTITTDTNHLPSGHSFVANANLEVSDLYGEENTRSVMYNGIILGESYRTLVASDIIPLEYALTGLDSLHGTNDDYSIELIYTENTNGCDIPVEMEREDLFAKCLVTSSNIQGSNDHFKIVTAKILLGSDTIYNWHFNQTPTFQVIFKDDFYN